MHTIIPVEMGETHVSNKRTDKLLAFGLGACVGLCLYDPITGTAAMVHIVLPVTPTYGARQPSSHGAISLPGKCADTALPHMLGLMQKQGVSISRLKAAIAGGAQIFTPPPQTGSTRPVSTISSRLEIGPRNVAAVKASLAAAGIPLLAENTGGHCGRTLTLEAGTGMVYVRMIGADERLLINLAEKTTAGISYEGVSRGR